MTERIEASKWCVLERDLRSELEKYEVLRQAFHQSGADAKSTRDLLWSAMGIASYISIALGVSVGKAVSGGLLDSDAP